MLQAVAVEGHENESELGFKVTLGRVEPGAWRVLHFDHYRQRPPKPN